MATKKLFDADAYLCEFDAEVVACEKAEGKEGIYKLVLEETAFFPEAGGQSPDKGIIHLAEDKEKAAEVVDVQIDKENIIYHYVDKEFEKGSKVHGILDFEHRYSHMQQHTGEHIYSGLVNKIKGYNNVGFHLSDSIVTMDYDGVLTMDEVRSIEKMANDCIYKNLDVLCEFPSEEELKNIKYRSKKELSGDIRIVTIPGYDVCACCAPHVHKTGEVGILKVMSCENYKGGVRLSILCGSRALEAFSNKQDALSEVAHILECSQESAAENTRRIMNEVSRLKGELAAARTELMNVKIEAVEKSLENVIMFTEAVPANIIRNAVNKLVAEHAGICAIFNGNDEEGYQYIIGSAQKDVREAGNLLKEKFNARGGGSPKMVQGSVQAGSSQIKEALGM